MKTNLYYETVFKRTNILKQTILGIFLLIASYPRLILEVFLRSNMGQRYFSMATSVTIFVILAFAHGMPHYSMYGGWEFGSMFGSLTENLSVTIFAVAFLFMSIKRYREIKTLPGTYDFKKFTLSSGDVHPFFYQLSFNGKQPTRRTIATIYEPGLCLIIGVVLTAFGTLVGPIIILCSIIYSLSYFGAYYQGDQFVLDKIDEMISNEELVNSFVNRENPEYTRGFEFMGDGPDSEKFRRSLADEFLQKEPATSVF